MKTLKIVFALDDDKTKTVSLLDPKNGLTRDTVKVAADTMVANQAIIVGGVSITAVKDMYISTVERTELA